MLGHVRTLLAFIKIERNCVMTVKHEHAQKCRSIIGFINYRKIAMSPSTFNVLPSRHLPILVNYELKTRDKVS